MIIPLDPENLTPAASLNRARFAQLPPSVTDEAAHGKTAYDLLSAAALADLVREHASALNLSQDLAASELLTRFDNYFSSAEPGVRSAADTIARQFGQSLGLLIAVLKRGDEANRRARPDWDDSYWTHWARVQQIWLGGGLVSGQLGQHIQHHAQAFLIAAGITECVVKRAEHPSLLPLIGAARSVPGTAQYLLVLDVGQSWVKRAVAVYDEGTVTELRLLPSVPAPLNSQLVGQVLTPEQVQHLADDIVALLTDAWQKAHARIFTLAPTIVMSLASYIPDNQPLPRQGGPYSQLHSMSNNFGGWLARHVSTRVGQAVEVTLLHDGTAAARTYAGTPNTAVIMLGTALGVGFAPKAAPRSVASQLALRQQL